MRGHHAREMLQCGNEERPRWIAKVVNDGLSVAGEVSDEVRVVRLDGDDHIVHTLRLPILVNEHGKRKVERKDEYRDVAIAVGGSHLELAVEFTEMFLQRRRVEEKTFGRVEGPIETERSQHRRTKRPRVRHGEVMILRESVLRNGEGELLSMHSDLQHLSLEILDVKVLRVIRFVLVVVSDEVDVKPNLRTVRELSHCHGWSHNLLLECANNMTETAEERLQHGRRGGSLMRSAGDESEVLHGFGVDVVLVMFRQICLHGREFVSKLFTAADFAHTVLLATTLLGEEGE
mmetsp:Transcript_19581/g.42285  ORF Transcript_19581/g.42285 Transcript_19581/m.42285 type:complete len:290 (+) Transcript_19581:622-1491(+)